MTTADIPGLAIEFAIQTVFLFIALLTMIKLQKLNYTFLGLIGSTVLTTGLGMTLDHFIGVSLSTPIVVIVLMVCITKLTGADHVDVGCTVAVSYALLFALNMWLLGILMGDLRVSAKDKDAQAGTAITQTNAVAQPTGTHAATNVSDGLPPDVPLMSDNFVLKGITQSPTTPLALIHDGRKSHTVTIGDTFTSETPMGKVKVTCKAISDGKVTLDVSGETVTLSFLRAIK